MFFQHDIFISYAHKDNLSLVENEDGWISKLHRVLEIRVTQFLGAKATIWRDLKLSGNDRFADCISEKLTQTGVMVSVLSPSYINSDWCIRELCEFWEASERNRGIAKDHEIPIFKVVKTPVPLEKHPKRVRQVLGYEFFTIDAMSGRPRELSLEGETQEKKKYLTRLDDLAYDVCNMLKKLRVGPHVSAEPKKTVYLAETGHDLAEDREILKRDLIRNGYQVLPSRALPTLASKCKDLICSELAKASLSIHMIGSSPGMAPDGGDIPIVRLQNQLADARRTDGFSRLIWIPPDLQVDCASQQRFLDELYTHAADQVNADVLQVGLEELKTAIYTELEGLSQQPLQNQPEPGRDEPFAVYIICDRTDMVEIRPLEDMFFDNGFEAILPFFDGDEQEVAAAHWENLCHCDAILLYYGNANELWLRRKLREIQKCPGQGREKPMPARAIYLARSQQFRTREAIVLRPDGRHLDKHLLEPFLAQLGRTS